MNSRERILGRIREALRERETRGSHEHSGGGQMEAFLPAVGGSWEDRVQQFRLNAAELRADFHLLPDAGAVTAELKRIGQVEGWTRVASHRSNVCREIVPAVGVPCLWLDSGASAVELETCDAGISACEVLVAQTGSVVVTSRGAGGRALSVLPPHHVVLARREQLVADLPEAFRCLQRWKGPGWPSMISFITGPSRTGDIERILVLGAHGPRKLTVLCW